jgi:hypothetical protein
MHGRIALGQEVVCPIRANEAGSSKNQNRSPRWPSSHFLSVSGGGLTQPGRA